MGLWTIASNAFRGAFWNGREGRFRAFWRACAVVVVWFVGVALIQSVMRGTLPEQPLRKIVEGPVIFLWVVVLVFIAGWFVDRRPVADFGFHFGRRWLGDLAAGLCIGAILPAGVLLVYLALGWARVDGWFHSPGGPYALALFASFFYFVMVGFMEEFVVRGFLLRNIAEGLRSRWLSSGVSLVSALVLSSAFFALLHGGKATGPEYAYYWLFGALFGLAFVLTGELALPIGIHIAYNFFILNVFGLEESTTAVIELTKTGPAFWVGEAAMGANLSVLFGILLVTLWVKRTRGKIEPRTDLAEYSRTSKRSESL